MDWNNFILAFIGGGLASGIAAWWLNRKYNKASTYEKLSTAVDNLTDDLHKTRAAWSEDKLWFQQELLRMKTDYQRKIKDLQRRVAELEKERCDLLLDNHRLQKLLNEHNT